MSSIGFVLAATIALLCWVALGTELRISVADSFAKGRSMLAALYLYLRFFTILTNLGLAVLMTTTCVGWLRKRALPSAPFYGAMLAYMLVTSLTYELLLRRLWSPHGIQFLSDMTMHDIAPALTLLFWIGFAPRNGARWRDPIWMLLYPLAYFVVTLIAGARGAGYPYEFFDATRLGYGPVLIAALVFLSLFLAIGIVTTTVSRRATRGAGQPVARTRTSVST